jgi:hypothetical protein
MCSAITRTPLRAAEHLIWQSLALTNRSDAHSGNTPKRRSSSLFSIRASPLVMPRVMPFATPILSTLFAVIIKREGRRGGELAGKVVRCLIGYLLKFSFHGKTEMSFYNTVPAQNSIVDR